jgi:O-antigen/teichoic acid export membrane protein
MNLMYPLLHSFAALLTLFIPILVRKRELSGLHAAKRTTLQLICMYLPLGLFYFAVLAIFRTPLLRLMYAGRYDNLSAFVVACVAFLPLTAGVIGLLTAALRSFEYPRSVFFGYLASSTASLLGGIPLTLRFGVPVGLFRPLSP